jgi:hypothetical protein
MMWHSLARMARAQAGLLDFSSISAALQRTAFS